MKTFLYIFCFLFGSFISQAQNDTLNETSVSIKYINNTFIASTISNNDSYTGYYTKSKTELHYYEAGLLRTIFLFDKENRAIKRYLKFTLEGVLIEEGKFNNSSKIGDWKYYLDSGELYCVGSFFKNKKTRKWKYYDTDKKLTHTEIYRKDVLLKTYPNN